MELQTPIKEMPKDIWPLQIPINAANDSHLKHALEITNKFLESGDAIVKLKKMMEDKNISDEKLWVLINNFEFQCLC